MKKEIYKFLEPLEVLIKSKIFALLIHALGLLVFTNSLDIFVQTLPYKFNP